MSVNDKMTAIANAIRSKTGDTAALTLDGMATAISGISGGGGASYDISADCLEGTTVNPVLDPSATSIRAYMFYEYTNLALTSLPSGLTSIGSNAFFQCYNLAITSLPSGLTSIGSDAFYECHNLALTAIPSKVTSIGIDAFHECVSIESITFEGKPDSIATSAFTKCTNLLIINVPWAEGAVANAPWGATNATINYDYTGA